ncbi:hypothetical protein P378_11545 [Desulforamulus profundi]|uniref:Uncharacterized protein n=1 Tax=Desulforamulus profundi TaxID=1383067 RepID=A0A2C6MET8_9FIRM|nr:hypothetical protein [Desulforamulus profundi]PHJ38172.1 hypothetical protein P378_11545 [Desulforamulus profundi]
MIIVVILARLKKREEQIQRIIAKKEQIIEQERQKYQEVNRKKQQKELNHLKELYFAAVQDTGHSLLRYFEDLLKQLPDQVAEQAAALLAQDLDEKINKEILRLEEIESFIEQNQGDQEQQILQCRQQIEELTSLSAKARTVLNQVS